MIDLTARVRHTFETMRRRRTRRRAVQDFRRSLALIVDPEALEASVATRLKEFFDPDVLILMQADETVDEYRPSFCQGIEPDAAQGIELSARGRLVRWLKVNESCLLVARDRGVVDYLTSPERKLLRRLGVGLCAPLLARNHLMGILLLGARRADWRPTRRDADLLLQLANQASLAFQNAALYREQQRRLERLHRADRLAAVGQLAASVAHEVRNPLTAIRSTMQYLAVSFRQDAEKKVLVEELIDEVDRINQTVSSLLSLTRAGELKLADVDLIELLSQTVRLVETQARKLKITVEERYDHPAIRLYADAGQLKQAFLNLILNALQAMPDGGRISVTARLERRERGPDRIRVSIADNGPGIPREQRKAVFDPFFTTKSEGTGMGLAICHGIVHRHEGEIELESTEGEGTTVSVELPQRAEPV